jgi:hypothetical protein
MAIEYTKNQAVFKDVVSVEEAETLLVWLQKKSSARVDFAGCTHMHPANLQVLMVAKPVVAAWPQDTNFRNWLKSALDIRH